MPENYDLDACSPFGIPHKLRWIADQYRDSEFELRAAWQDDSPKGWAIIAGALDMAAGNIEAGLRRSGLPVDKESLTMSGNPDPAWPYRPPRDGPADYSKVQACGVIRCNDGHRRLWQAVRLKKDSGPGLWSLDVTHPDGEYLSGAMLRCDARDVAQHEAQRTAVTFLPETLVYVHDHFYRNPEGKER